MHSLRRHFVLSEFERFRFAVVLAPVLSSNLAEDKVVHAVQVLRTVKTSALGRVLSIVLFA